MAQLVGSLPQTPEICGSNLVIGQFYLQSTVLKNVNKEKEAGNGPNLLTHDKSFYVQNGLGCRQLLSTISIQCSKGLQDLRQQF